MFKQLKKRSQGFTIIEVLIVLAIAGLILLVVFLAVPALQRNNRNNQYKTESNNIAAATQEFIGNNNSTLPVCSPTYPCTAGDPATILGNANTKKITSLTLNTAASTTAITPTFSGAFLEAGVKCGTVSGTTVTPTTTNATASSMIVVFAIETSSGGVQAQCKEL